MQSYKYKQNLMYTNTLDNYHIINAPLALYDKKYAIQIPPEVNPSVARLLIVAWVIFGPPCICKCEGLGEYRKETLLQLSKTILSLI